MISAPDSPTAVPLSATRPDHTRGLGAFIDSCSWVDRPDAFSADVWMLTLLDERTRWLEAERLGHTHRTTVRAASGAPELPRVGDLPHDWIVPLLEDVRLRYPGWRLDDADDAPLIDRLDQHYGRRQAARAAEVAAREVHDAGETRRREEANGEIDRLHAARDRALYGVADSD